MLLLCLLPSAAVAAAALSFMSSLTEKVMSHGCGVAPRREKGRQVGAKINEGRWQRRTDLTTASICKSRNWTWTDG